MIRGMAPVAMLVATLAVAGCGGSPDGSAGPAPTPEAATKATTTGSTTGSTTGRASWKAAAARFDGAQAYTFVSITKIAEGSPAQLTIDTDGAVDRAQDASRVSVVYTNAGRPVPGSTIVLSVADEMWMQMTAWKPPNKGKWLRMTGNPQLPESPGQQTLLEGALHEFAPSADLAVNFQVVGRLPLAVASKLMGLSKLGEVEPDLSGDLEATFTIDTDGTPSHLRIDGGTINGDKLSDDSRPLVLATVYDAEIDLTPERVVLEAPPRATVVSDLVRTG